MARLENGGMLNDTHTWTCQSNTQQFPDVRSRQSPLLGQSLLFAVTDPPVLHVDIIGESL